MLNVNIVPLNVNDCNYVDGKFFQFNIPHCHLLEMYEVDDDIECEICSSKLCVSCCCSYVLAFIFFPATL